MSGLAFTGWDEDAVWRVLHEMRPADAAEAYALQPHDSPGQLFAALALVQPSMPYAEVAWRGLLGRPLAVLAITLASPGVGNASMVATPEMGLADFRAWRRRLRAILPGACARAGLHRLQCSTLEGHRAAQRFLAACDWRCEGREEALGRRGESFQRWVALARDFPAAGVPRSTEEELTCAG